MIKIKIIYSIKREVSTKITQIKYYLLGTWQSLPVGRTNFLVFTQKFSIFCFLLIVLKNVQNVQKNNFQPFFYLRGFRYPRYLKNEKSDFQDFPVSFSFIPSPLKYPSAILFVSICVLFFYLRKFFHKVLYFLIISITFLLYPMRSMGESISICNSIYPFNLQHSSSITRHFKRSQSPSHCLANRLSFTSKTKTIMLIYQPRKQENVLSIGTYTIYNGASH